VAGEPATDGRDILKYQFGLTPDWHEMPLRIDSDEAWATALAATLLPGGGPVAEGLQFQLAKVQANVSGMDIDGMTAAVWVPDPESGYVTSAIGFALAPRAEDETPERILLDFESDRGREMDGTTFIEVETWRGDIAAGPFVAVRNLLSHLEDDGAEGWIEERTIFAILPPGANQIVQVFFSAESIGSFWNMPAQTQQIVATLTVQLEQFA
jgi:hypothetical protein